MNWRARDCGRKMMYIHSSLGDGQLSMLERKFRRLSPFVVICRDLFLFLRLTSLLPYDRNGSWIAWESMQKRSFFPKPPFDIKATAGSVFSNRYIRSIERCVLFDDARERYWKKNRKKRTFGIKQRLINRGDRAMIEWRNKKIITGK